MDLRNNCVSLGTTDSQLIQQKCVESSSVQVKSRSASPPLHQKCTMQFSVTELEHLLQDDNQLALSRWNQPMFTTSVLASHVEPSLASQLLRLVQVTRQQPRLAIALSNALSLLALVRGTLNRLYLRNVVARNSNFHCAELKETVFCRSDLRHSRFFKSVLQRTKFTNCNLLGCQFGKGLSLPSAKHVALSPDFRMGAFLNNTEVIITNLGLQTFQVIKRSAPHGLLLSQTYLVVLCAESLSCYELVSRKKVCTVDGQYNVCEFLNDTRLIAASKSGGFVCIDIITREILHSFGDKIVHSLKKNPYGPVMAAGSGPATLLVYSLETDSILWEETATLAGRHFMAFSQNSFIFAQTKTLVQVTSEAKLKFESHTSSIHSVIYNDVTGFVISASIVEVIVWQLPSPLRVFQSSKRIWSVDVSEDFQLIMRSTPSGISIRPTQPPRTTHARILSADVSKDSSKLVTQDPDWLRLWSLEHTHLLDQVRTAPASRVEFSGVGDYVTSIGPTSFTLRPSSNLKLIHWQHSPNPYIFHKTQPWVCIINGTTVQVWNFETIVVLRTLAGHSACVNCIDLSNDLLSSGSKDSTVKLWDVTNGTLLCTLSNHRFPVEAVRIYCEDKIVVSSSHSRVIVWNALTGGVIRSRESADFFVTRFKHCHHLIKMLNPAYARPSDLTHHIDHLFTFGKSTESATSVARHETEIAQMVTHLPMKDRPHALSELACSKLLFFPNGRGMVSFQNLPAITCWKFGKLD